MTRVLNIAVRTVWSEEGTVADSSEETRDTIGMTPIELLGYLEALLAEEAAEAAAERGTTVEEELDSPGFAAVRAST
jgi:hypothetical protein